MARQWKRTVAVCGVLAGSAFVLGCPGKDSQELRPLSELRAEAEGSAQEAPAKVEGDRVETAHAEYPEPWQATDFSPSTGTANWRGDTGGRNSDVDITFGQGVAQAAPGGQWAFSTDSTGATGDALGTGVTYGASRGVGTFAQVRGKGSSEAPSSGSKAAAPAKKK